MTPNPSNEHPAENVAALFPLPNAVLFPGMPLPLLVFEPRYQALVADVLETQRLVAVPHIRGGTNSLPHLAPVCGVGKLVEHRALDDGRFEILLLGQYRGRLGEDLQLAPFRIATFEILHANKTEDAPTASALRTILQGQVERLCQRLPPTVGKLVNAARALTDPGRCADLLASTLVVDDRVRQDLLEETNVIDRLERLTLYIDAQLERQTSSPSRSSN